VRCLIHLERPGEARQYLGEINEPTPHALTMTLQFQIAVRLDDEAMGAQLHVIVVADV
jgi:hypothetical protein